MRIEVVLPVVSQCVSLVSHFVNLFWRCVFAHLNFHLLYSQASCISNLSHVTKNSFVLVVASCNRKMQASISRHWPEQLVNGFGHKSFISLSICCRRCCIHICAITMTTNS